MKAVLMRYLLTVTVLFCASPAAAGQHDHAATQGPGVPEIAGDGQGSDAAQVAACVQSQRDAILLIEAAETRLEAARQSNEPLAMRAAIDDLHATLSRTRARLASCDTLAAAAPPANPHAGDTMPNQSISTAPPGMPAMAPGSPTVAPGAPKPGGADPHAGHVMTPTTPSMKPAPTAPATKPGPPAAKPPATEPHAGHAMPAAKPAPKSTKPPAAKPPTDPHAGHTAPPTKPDPKRETAAANPQAVELHAGQAPSTAASPDNKAVDPVCGLKVDPPSAPSARHQGGTYYFCSTQHRDLFVKNPAKFLPSKQ